MEKHSSERTSATTPINYDDNLVIFICNLYNSDICSPEMAAKESLTKDTLIEGIFAYNDILCESVWRLDSNKDWAESENYRTSWTKYIITCKMKDNCNAYLSTLCISLLQWTESEKYDFVKLVSKKTFLRYVNWYFTLPHYFYSTWNQIIGLYQSVHDINATARCLRYVRECVFMCVRVFVACVRV